MAVESPSPVPSTPLDGVSLRGKWTFPEESSLTVVRKKLFELEAAEANESDQKSPSSEYFSMSVNDASYTSGESPTNLFTPQKVRAINGASYSWLSFV